MSSPVSSSYSSCTRRRTKSTRIILASVTVFLLLILCRTLQKQEVYRHRARLAPPPAALTVTHIAFVSCNRHDRSQVYWSVIAAAAQCEVLPFAHRSASPDCQMFYQGRWTARNASIPVGACGTPLTDTPRDVKGLSPRPPLDALLWLGDAIYADKQADGRPHQSLSQTDNTLDVVAQMWTTQRLSAPYTAFRHSCLRTDALERGAAESPGTRPCVYGTWDDHDMGMNDAGKDYAHRATTQGFFLDFLEAPPSDPRRHRDGVYAFHTIPFDTLFTDPNATAPQNDRYGIVERAMRAVYLDAVCVVLLDARSFRDPPNATYAGDMLGEAQWRWLDETLTTNKDRCALTLIGSGVQLSLDEKPAENWAEFPRSRDKLFALLRARGIERTAFLTGDVHMGEIGADFSLTAVQSVLGYPLVETTSSGLTHSAAMAPGLSALMPLLLPTPRRVGLYVGRNFATAKLVVDEELVARCDHRLRSLLDDKAASDVTRRDGIRQIIHDITNVTFTVFSLDEGGAPVFRLNAPLQMLTYAGGSEYLGATVTPAGEVVRSPSVAPQLPSRTTPLSTVVRGGEEYPIPAYPTSFPPPIITQVTRWMQFLVFHNSSVSCTLKHLVAVILVSVVVVVCACAMCFFLLWRSKRNCRASFRLERPDNPLNTTVARYSEFPAFLSRSQKHKGG